jgi:hypothetical protein
LVIEIYQKEEMLLRLILQPFRGNISFNPVCESACKKKRYMYYYSTVNFESAKKIIEYFDVFHLMGVKMTQYVLWRKVYIKIQEQFHLKKINVKWIINGKKTNE